MKRISFVWGVLHPPETKEIHLSGRMQYAPYDGMILGKRKKLRQTSRWLQELLRLRSVQETPATSLSLVIMKHLRPWIKFSGVFIMLCWYLGQLLISSSINGKSTDRGFRYRRKFCCAALSILNIHYRQDGHLQSGACLYVSNHRSMLDPLIQLGHMDAYIVSKAEVGNYPVLGRGAKETGIILVHRHDHNSRRAALDAIEEKLLSGFQVLVYPEATTYGGDLTGEFKKGAIEMAFRKGIPIVPVMIEYPDAGYYWTDSSLLSYFKRLFASRTSHIVSGSIGLPMKSESPDTIVEDIRASINHMITIARFKSHKS